MKNTQNNETKKDSKGRKLKDGEDQLKDGRYRYRYTDRYGKRCSVYSWKLTSTDKTPVGKKEDICLREKIKKIMTDNVDELNGDKNNITLNELMELYLQLKTNLAITTKNNYIHVWEKNIKQSWLGKMKVVKICKSDILKFYAHLYEVKKFKIGTLQLYQNLLYPCFQVAVDDNIIRRNPCTGCMKDYKRGSLGSTKEALTRSQQTVLLQFLKNDETYYPLYSLIACVLGSGLRIGETIGLTWDDVDFENKCIKVNHQVIYKSKGVRKEGEEANIKFFATHPKNNSVRTIPIHNDLISILKKHRAETYFLSKTSGTEIDGYSDFVFINREGNLRTPNTITRSIHGIINAYNKKEEFDSAEEKREPIYLPDFSLHVLRHTYCTRMAENGVDVKVLQELMGHKNIQVTMQVYNHSNFERAQKELEKIQSVINL